MSEAETVREMRRVVADWFVHPYEVELRDHAPTEREHTLLALQIANEAGIQLSDAERVFDAIAARPTPNP